MHKPEQKCENLVYCTIIVTMPLIAPHKEFWGDDN